VEFKKLRSQQLEKFIAEDCKKQIPANPYETEDIRVMSELSSFDQQRMYEPHQSYSEDFSISGKN